jgi:hypothetical protein
MSDKEGKLTGTKIIIDSETGVQYLFAFDGSAGGLTILVDKNGDPLLNEQFASPAFPQRQNNS